MSPRNKHLGTFPTNKHMKRLLIQHHDTRGHNNSTPSTQVLEQLSHDSRASSKEALSVGVTRNAGKRKTAAPRAQQTAVSPRATNESKNSGLSWFGKFFLRSETTRAMVLPATATLRFDGSHKARRQGRALAPRTEQRSPLPSRRPLPSISPPALESGATASCDVTRRQKTSTLWAFYVFQGTEKEKKRAKCIVEDCEKVGRNGAGAVERIALQPSNQQDISNH